MKRENVIVMLGIIAIILSAFRFANAEDVKYTKGRYNACPYLSDLAKIKNMLEKNDLEAANKQFSQGKCFVTKPDIPVYMLDIEPGFDVGIATGTEYNYAIKFRFRGSTDTFWTSHKAFSERLGIGAGEGSSQMSTREWFVLKSFLWIKPNETKKQEIIQKYGKPAFQDEDSILYKTNQNPDFKEWKTIKFIFNTSGVIEGIRAEK